MNIKHRILLIVMLASPFPALADAFSEAMMLLENQQMQRLARQQTKPGVVIDAFRTDGCSGGMSEAWTFMAEISPEIAEIIGAKPPWENCCVAHDESYWRGESQNGFEKRKQADLALRACVRREGGLQSAEISRQLGLPQQEVVELFNNTADLMYQAVRLGGGPCTGLPWAVASCATTGGAAWSTHTSTPAYFSCSTARRASGCVFTKSIISGRS